MLYLLLQKKKCKSCGKISHKDVLFCWFCGCSFGLRICASGHKNPSWVLHCLTCGKDRTLMSQPHSSRGLSFTKHPTKPFTYIPGHKRTQRALAWSAIILGTAILCCAAFLLTCLLERQNEESEGVLRFHEGVLASLNPMEVRLAR